MARAQLTILPLIADPLLFHFIPSPLRSDAATDRSGVDRASEQARAALFAASGAKEDGQTQTHMDDGRTAEEDDDEGEGGKGAQNIILHCVGNQIESASE